MLKTRTEKIKGVMERSKSLDGKFVYAVTTTGIYCRPSCPSRRPLTANIAFFDTPESAREAGYRACSRCRPDQQSSRPEEIAEMVSQFIQSNLGDTLTLKTIAEGVGMSPYHMQRVFKSVMGLTPKQFADQQRLDCLKRELKNGKSVTDATYEAGYGSSSRLYERSNAQLGMTPGRYAKRGKGEQISFAFSKTPLGLVLIGATERGICFLQFGQSKQQLLDELRQEFQAATFVEDRGALVAITRELNSYLLGGATSFATKLDLTGTPFQKQVWRTLCDIAPGETRTYTEIAQAIGKPEAVRAVARACAQNKIAIVVPCHRVIRQDGSLAGYRWGLPRKEALLRSERSNKK